MILALGSNSSLFLSVIPTMKSKSSWHKCRHCSRFFTPDYRNRHHQHFCSLRDCRRSSKAASQRRWVRQASNRDYFRGPEQTRRVQQWRKDHPGYWKKGPPAAQIAASQAAKPEQTSCNTGKCRLGALQDVCLAQDPVFVGLLSVVTGSALQEDIAATIGDLLFRGQKILEPGASGSTSSKTL